MSLGRTRKLFVYIISFTFWHSSHGTHFQLQHEDTGIVQSSDLKPFYDKTVNREMQCFLKCSHNQCKCYTVEVKKIANDRFQCLLYDHLLSDLKTVYEQNSKISSIIAKHFKGKSCLELHQNGRTEDGIYEICVGGKITKVFCDMKTNGGGWTVFQRRINGSVDFSRSWSDYKQGFGSLDGEFWLGNDLIHQITKNTNGVMIRLQTTSVVGLSKYIIFDGFYIEDESNKFRMPVGTGVEGSTYLMKNQDSVKMNDGFQFTTFDQDNSNVNCVEKSLTGGFWYASSGRCSMIRPNSVYLAAGVIPDHAKHMRWSNWKYGETNTFLEFFEMSIK